MVDTPLDRLLEIGYQDLRRNQAEFKRVAARIDARRAPEPDPPGPGERSPRRRASCSIPSAACWAACASSSRQRHIVTIPSPVPPIVEETPPFMRALTTASMDTPGPFENVAKEAFFNVTLPEPAGRPSAVEEYMQGFNRGTILSTAIHEVYPGHYTQFLWVKQAPTKVRKLVGCGSNAEGWAHYSEQMMLDEGYGDGDLKLRLGQLQDALLRDARFIAGIQMHTGKMTMEQAVEFFVKEGYQVRPVAEKEAKRGTSDPTYLVYTLGKLRDPEVAGGLQEDEGRGTSVAGIPRRLHAPGVSADQDRAPGAAGERFAGAVRGSDQPEFSGAGRPQQPHGAVRQGDADRRAGQHVAQEVHAQQNPRGRHADGAKKQAKGQLRVERG